MTQEKITELKAKYGKIYRININDNDWYYRAMTREEFKIYTKEQISKGEELTQVDLEDLVFIMCNLDGIDKEKIKTLPAGIVGTVADAIMKSTGFSDTSVPEEL